MKEELKALVLKMPGMMYRSIHRTEFIKELTPHERSRKNQRLFQNQQEFDWHYLNFLEKLKKFRQEIKTIPNQSDDYKKSVEHVLREISALKKMIDVISQQEPPVSPMGFLRCMPY